MYFVSSTHTTSRMVQRVARKPTHAKPIKQGQTCWKGFRIDPFNTSDCDLLVDSTGVFQQPIRFDAGDLMLDSAIQHIVHVVCICAWVIKKLGRSMMVRSYGVLCPK